MLCEAIAYYKEHRISTLLVSELSRMGRNAFEVLASVKELIDSGINLYIQKEQFNLLDDDGKPSLFAPVMLATLSTCAQLERDNITFRLQSGRKCIYRQRWQTWAQARLCKICRPKKRRIQGCHCPIEERLRYQGRGKADG